MVVEGPKVCEELLRSPLKVRDAFATSLWFSSNMHLISDPETRTHELEEAELKKLSFLKSPNQILCLAEIPAPVQLDDFLQGSVICLDQINDPGNLGTILRTADWFGLGKIVLSPNSVDPWNEKTIMASMGSIFRMKILTADLRSFLGQRGKDQVVAAHPRGGESGLAFDENSVLLFGSESHGLGADLLELAGRTMSIPGASRAESLNLSISVGILLGEWYRQTRVDK